MTTPSRREAASGDSSPRARSPKAGSPKAGSPKAGSPKAASTGDGSVDAVFGALADPTRRHLLRAVAASGPDGATATELAEDVDVSRQAVVKHLQALAAAGLAAPERHGREQRYRATPAPLGDAVAWLIDNGAVWDRRLDRLRRQVERL